MSATFRRTLIACATETPAPRLAVYSQHEGADCCSTGRVVRVTLRDVLLVVLEGKEKHTASIPIESITSVDVLEGGTAEIHAALKEDVDDLLAQNEREKAATG